VVVLGVLGGAFSGGFTSLASLGLGSLVSLLGQTKEFTGRGVVFAFIALPHLSLRSCSFLSALSRLLMLFALPAINSLKKQWVKSSPAPENFAQE